MEAERTPEDPSQDSIARVVSRPNLAGEIVHMSIQQFSCCFHFRLMVEVLSPHSFIHKLVDM